MHVTTRSRARALALAGLIVAACGSKDGGGPGPEGQDSGPQGSPDAGTSCRDVALAWTFTVVDEGNAGHQPHIVRAPNGKLGVAYYRAAASQGMCMKGGNPPAPISRWEVVYAAEERQFQPEVVATTDLVTVAGLSLAYDGMNEPGIAFQGGETAEFWCGGANMMLAKRSGGRWMVSTVDASGQADDFPIAGDQQNCADLQNYCNTAGAGEAVVGLWPALGYVGGQLFLAYRDIAYGFAMDDFIRSDIELLWNRRSTLDASWGGGTYLRLAVDGAGHPSLVHFNPSPTTYGLGIYLLRHDGTSWSRKKISSETHVGYTLGFATTGSRHGVAYYSTERKKLFYLESGNGKDWPADSEVVDQSGNTGLSPSLAFDGSGRPAIAYYRCGEYVPGTNDCMPGRDGLRFAIKGCDGAWKASDVKSEASGRDGVNTSLAYDQGGLPAIAYQAVYPDPATRTVIRQLVLARGRAR